MTQNVDVPRISMSGLGQVLPTTVDLVVDGASGDLNLEYEWAMICKEIFELFKEKQLDYGPHNIGLGQDNAVLTRITDKFMRLHTLYGTGREPNNESIEDTWKDLADYSVIALMCIRGHWPQSVLTDVLKKDEVLCESKSEART